MKVDDDECGIPAYQAEQREHYRERQAVGVGPYAIYKFQIAKQRELPRWAVVAIMVGGVGNLILSASGERSADAAEEKEKK